MVCIKFNVKNSIIFIYLFFAFCCPTSQIREITDINKQCKGINIEIKQLRLVVTFFPIVN